MEPLASGCRAAGHPSSCAHARADPRCAYQHTAGRSAVCGGPDPSCSRDPYCYDAGTETVCPAEHVDVTLCPSRSSLTQELSCRYPAVACVLSLRVRGSFGGGCLVSAGVLLTSELR